MANLQLIDSHCHIYSDKLSTRLDEIIRAAEEVGIAKIFMPNIDKDSIEAMMRVEELYPQCKSTMGLHPCSVDFSYKDALQWITQWVEKRPFVGIGETGIDLYWDKTYIEEQKRAFDYQIDLSIDLDLPIIIHSRDSLDLTIDMITAKQKGRLKGVFHCFNGTSEQAQKIIDCGFFMGIGGVITYKNSGLEAMLTALPLTSIVLETDSPYLAPVPHRGKDNEPAFLLHVLKKLSEIKGISETEMAEITTQNALYLFSNNL